ncbi:hypothetical protein PQS31_08000 [Luteimonas sp BLCC-B24]|uniref:hypothetical protein n=1 Tax=Luteimonas sp. BLCC-B24 TaxID=3025317 RepID=UPI00234D8598|nr:hypothetical protein [Luteimonas sp. BLCC-B24]MDC7806759.1 hypothetical protein [Luteimonas sp. BLCC-B24]
MKILRATGERRPHPAPGNDPSARCAEAVFRSPRVSALVGAVLFLAAVTALVHVTRQQMLSAMTGATHASVLALVGAPQAASADCAVYAVR